MGNNILKTYFSLTFIYHYKKHIEIYEFNRISAKILKRRGVHQRFRGKKMGQK